MNVAPTQAKVKLKQKANGVGQFAKLGDSSLNWENPEKDP